MRKVAAICLHTCTMHLVVFVYFIIFIVKVIKLLSNELTLTLRLILFSYWRAISMVFINSVSPLLIQPITMQILFVLSPSMRILDATLEYIFKLVISLILNNNTFLIRFLNYNLDEVCCLFLFILMKQLKAMRNFSRCIVILM